MDKQFNYYNRNFLDFRSELINYIKRYYPNILNDFSDASVGMMLLELNAAIGDMLSYHIDRSFQETQIDFAQNKESLLSIARTYGLKIPHLRPSIALVDFFVIVPNKGDGPDMVYAPVLKAGTQVIGGSQKFELLNNVDFSSNYTIGGLENLKIIPQKNSSDNIINYKLVKREIVVNGETKYYKEFINPGQAKPFYEVILPENNVLSVESIITLPGMVSDYDVNFDDFYNEEYRWYEVDSLAESKVFVEDFNHGIHNGIFKGKYLDVSRRFITEYTNNGFLRIIFGAGTQDISFLNEFGYNQQFVNYIGNLINNMSLGQMLKDNTTLIVKYRVGGGVISNLGPNMITGFGLVNIIANGPNPQINLSVERSLGIASSSMAIGGKDEPDIDEIRYMIKYNFSAQNRCVTIKDYLAILKKMPSKFGVPFKMGVFEEQNKIVISILNLDSNGLLSNSGNDILMENIATYLSEYRMLNDYIEVRYGKIINLAFEIDLLINNLYIQSDIINEAIKITRNFVDINKQEMGEHLYLTQLITKLSQICGVLNVIDLRVYNRVGINYNGIMVMQPFIDEQTKLIDTKGNHTIFNYPDSIFEIRFPDNDIKIRIKTLN